MSDQKPVLALDNITRSFTQGGSEVEVIRQTSLSIFPSEVVALVGPSGSGKTTLLQIAGLVDRANSGEVYLQEVPLNQASGAKRTRQRGQHIGFIYQMHHLLPEFSALENVMMPQRIAGISKKKAKIRATELLERLDLGDRLYHRPAQLSGGQRQRVAIARAVVSHPPIILADEPTGNLDPATAEMTFQLLLDLVNELGLSMLMVTHNKELAERANRVITLCNHTIHEE